MEVLEMWCRNRGGRMKISPEKIILQARLLYFACEKGLPKDVSEFYQKQIIRGNIDGVELNKENKTFRFILSKNVI